MSAPETAFWDASALIPLCVHEAGSSRARSLLRRHPPVVWWATPIEIQSAIARLRRSCDLDDSGQTAAMNRLGLLRQGWREILPSDPLRALAEELPGKYSLRAADSLQLAAALVWCRQVPARRTFVCGDQRLAFAATAAGFATLKL